MLNLWLLVLVVAVALMVLLWAGGMFLQSYIYTEPSPHLMWGAPAGGALLGAFFAWWLFAVAKSPESRPEEIPYDTIFRFSPRVDMVKEPVRELWAVKKNGEKVLYKRHRIDQNRWEYKDAALDRPWNGSGVEAIELVHDGEKYRFDKEAKTESGGYLRFVNDKGWTMTSGERGPRGEPTTFRTSRFLANLFFNGVHLLLWFACLWLLLRFQWAHALGLAFCLWLVTTLAILPMMLEQAARLAQARPAATTGWIAIRLSM